MGSESVKWRHSILLLPSHVQVTILWKRPVLDWFQVVSVRMEILRPLHRPGRSIGFSFFFFLPTERLSLWVPWNYFIYKELNSLVNFLHCVPFYSFLLMKQGKCFLAGFMMFMFINSSCFSTFDMKYLFSLYQGPVSKWCLLVFQNLYQFVSMCLKFCLMV